MVLISLATVVTCSTVKHSRCERRPEFQEDTSDTGETDPLPVYKLADLARNNGKNGSRVWITYDGIVYDVTDFLARHPDGAENILSAAGNSVELFWNLYRQHYASDVPMNVIEDYIIGMLDDDEHQILDEKLTDANHNNPYKMTRTQIGAASGWIWAGGGRNIVRVHITGDGGKTWYVADVVEGGSQPGWVWAEGGRNIVRVHITGDGGKTWYVADVVEGGSQPFGRAWAWVFWKVNDVTAAIDNDGKMVDICSKAVNTAYNIQTETCNHIW
eukprot:CAMPEP_0194393252 /NCGR_PEP_ID=MMETSP0174-20130528/123197_1 /TAXON_ID=216777 /ORGANISM="Proboscia alata, Strain PI-D3" /LENGTH=271 /DNA_ID=CAMNT_0039188919 /DNA_START=286 /DNA_END=1099 /DNA_ORIENTATION=+